MEAFCVFYSFLYLAFFAEMLSISLKDGTPQISPVGISVLIVFRTKCHYLVQIHIHIEEEPYKLTEWALSRREWAAQLCVRPGRNSNVYGLRKMGRLPFVGPRTTGALLWNSRKENGLWAEVGDFPSFQFRLISRSYNIRAVMIADNNSIGRKT